MSKIIDFNPYRMGVGRSFTTSPAFQRYMDELRAEAEKEDAATTETVAMPPLGAKPPRPFVVTHYGRTLGKDDPK